MARPRKQTYTLKMYMDKIKDGDICNDGDVQRNMAWTSEQISELIVTVLTDDYIPPIILGEEDSSQLHIVDGGCRSSALLLFRYGNRKISPSIENPVILYKKKSKDENGNIIWNDAEFNIKNKTFDKLPDELKKKFDEYQIETVIHEHCDRHKISKYIKRYNNHIAMNTNQKAFTYIDNFAKNVREILNNKFFLNDYSSFTESEKNKGVVERVVVETIMCTNHFDAWKKQTKFVCDYLNKNATVDEFEKLNKNLHRLENVITEDVKDMFNSKDAFLLLTLFDKFSDLGLDDKEFINFLLEFQTNYRINRRNDNGILFDEIDENRSTKDRTVISEKLEMLEVLMKEYLHISDESIDVVQFISENVGIEKEEVDSDISFYEETLNDLENECIRCDSKLLNQRNRPSLLAMVAYSYSNDVDLDEWLSDYAKVNNTYFVDQKKNYLHMKRSLEKYIDRKVVA